MKGKFTQIGVKKMMVYVGIGCGVVVGMGMMVWVNNLLLKGVKEDIKRLEYEVSVVEGEVGENNQLKGEVEEMRGIFERYEKRLEVNKHNGMLLINYGEEVGRKKNLMIVDVERDKKGVEIGEVGKRKIIMNRISFKLRGSYKQTMEWMREMLMSYFQIDLESMEMKKGKGRLETEVYLVIVEEEVI